MYQLRFVFENIAYIVGGLETERDCVGLIHIVAEMVKADILYQCVYWL